MIRVFVDDQEIKPNDDRTYTVKKGKRTLKVTRDGFADWKSEGKLFVFSETETIQLLFRVPVSIETHPKGLPIRVTETKMHNGKKESVTISPSESGQYNLTAGSHSLKIETDRFPSKLRNLTVSPDHNRLNVSFGIPVEFDFGGKVSTVLVKVDGVNKSKDEIKNLCLPVGKYDFEFSQTGFEFPKLKQVEIKRGMDPIIVKPVKLAKVKFEMPADWKDFQILANQQVIDLNSDNTFYSRPGEFEFEVDAGERWRAAPIKKWIGKEDITIRVNATPLQKITLDVQDKDGREIQTAQILINQEAFGLKRSFLLPPGVYNLAIRDNHYQFQTQRFDVADQDLKLAALGLRLIPVQLTFDPKPREIKLQLEDGNPLPMNEQGFVSLPEDGKHLIQAVAKGYESKSVEVVPSVQRAYEVELKKSILTPIGTIVSEGASFHPVYKMPSEILLEKTKTLGLPLRLVLIVPSENAVIGKSGDLDRGELLERDANLKTPYYMGVTEVSNAQYAVFANEVGVKQAGSEWKTKGLADQDTHPVVNITFENAMAFCKWANGSLPTEAQWEIAGRNNNKNLFPWGEDLPDESQRKKANLLYESNGGLQAADSNPKGKTPLGLKNMLGNVWEICSDDYTPGSNDDAKSIKPGSKVMKGGGFNTVYYEVRLTSRTPFEKTGKDIGFRLMIPIE